MESPITTGMKNKNMITFHDPYITLMQMRYGYKVVEPDVLNHRVKDGNIGACG